MDDADRPPVTDEALDRQLGAAFGVEPSPAFMARIRSRVASESMRPSWQTGAGLWRMGGLSVAAAALLAAVLWRPSVEVTPPPASTAVQTAPPVAAGMVPSKSPLSTDIPAPAPAAETRRLRSASRSARRTASPDGEHPVIIAADEAAALRRLFADVREGRVAAMLPDLPTAPASLTPIEAIEIPPIAMTPLSSIEPIEAL